MPVQSYHISYYSLVLIPLGLVFYLLIKFGSDISISNKALMINSSDYANTEESLIKFGGWVDAIRDTQRKNDNVFMLKGLPIEINELGLESAALYHGRYLGILLGSNGVIRVHNGMLLVDGGKDCYRDFAARKAYDRFITCGDFSLKGSDSMVGFLGRNNIVATRDINIGCLNRKAPKSINLFSFNKIQGRILENRKHLFAEGNGLLLFLSVNGAIKVVYC